MENKKAQILLHYPLSSYTTFSKTQTDETVLLKSIGGKLLFHSDVCVPFFDTHMELLYCRKNKLCPQEGVLS